MKKKEILDAINVIMLAVGQKFGGGEGGSIVISDEDVSVDGPEGVILTDHESPEAAAEALET